MTEMEKKENNLESPVEISEKNESFEVLKDKFVIEVEKQISDFKDGDEGKIQMIEKSTDLDDAIIEEVKKDLKVEETLKDLNIKARGLENVIKKELEKVIQFIHIFNYSEKINKILKIIITAQAIAGGVIIRNEVGVGKLIKKDIEIYTAKSYSIEDNIKNQDYSKFFTDDFISEVALTLKGENEESMVENKDVLLSIYNSGNKSKIPFDKSDSESFLNQIKNYKLNFETEKNKLTLEEKMRGKEKIIEMLALVEQARIELINHIQSDEYFNNLMNEMNISETAAKEHQKTRINNIKNLSLEFKTDSGIWMDTDGFAYAYYRLDLNKIFMPYNINLKNDYEKKIFYEALIHELLHGCTQVHRGMSKKSFNILNESFQKKDSTETKELVDYYSEPVELIVRKQVLDLEMEKLGIKKYGEKFTDEHYKILLELKVKGVLSSDVEQFIDHIKPEKFSEVMNELAENKEDNKTYYHPDWDYIDTENNT